MNNILTINEAKSIVKRVLLGMPVDIYDEETDEMIESVLYELCEPRSKGDFEGCHTIGGANIVSAFNLILQKLMSTKWKRGATEEDTQALARKLYAEALDDLQKEKVIRKIPERVRESFKVVGGKDLKKESEEK